MIRTMNKKYLVILLFNFWFITITNAQTEDQRAKVILRAIGNEFLLQLNDSTSGCWL